MRIYSNQSKLLLGLISNKTIKAVVLYGKDQGLINWIISQIKSVFDDSYEIFNGTYEEIFGYCNTAPFAGKSCIISKHNTATSDLTDLVTSNLNNFSVFTIEDLKPNNALRRYSETAPDIAIIPCYSENKRSTEEHIRTVCEKKDIVLDSQLMDYLLSLTSDKFMLSTEIDKIIHFLGGTVKHISILDVIDILPDQTGASIIELASLLAENQYSKYLEELEKLMLQMNSITICRSIVNFYNNVFYVKANMEDGISQQLAIDEIKKSIFFAHMDKFTHCIKILSINRVYKILKFFLELETKINEHSHEYIRYANHSSLFNMDTLKIN